MKHYPTTHLVRTNKGWTLREFESVQSTIIEARDLDAWHAVLAGTETDVRGRLGEKRASPKGGLWMSAVVPAERKAADWGLVPLASSLAVCQVLTRLGVPSLRMRWPQDLMVDHSKLGDVSVHDLTPNTAIIEVRINGWNSSEIDDNAFEETSSRLEEFLHSRPDLAEICFNILEELKLILDELEFGNSEDILLRINKLFIKGSLVELELDGTVRLGLFSGVNDKGSLLLKESSGRLNQYQPAQVKHLAELID